MSGHIPGILGFQIVLIEPQQLVGIESGRRPVHRREIEQVDHFLAAENFLVPMRPAQAHQIVQQRLGQVAVIAILQHADGAMALGQALTVGAQDHRDMGIGWRGYTDRPQQIDLPGSIIDVIVAANDMGDAHVRIVDHHREVIGGRSVGTGDDEIVELGVVESDGPAHQILEHHLPVRRVAEAHHRANALGRWILTVAAQAVISRLFLGHHLLGPQRIEPFPAAIAPIGRPLRKHTFNDLPVTIKTLGLIIRTVIVLEAEPRHALEDGLDVFVGRALPVGILHPQDESPALAARVEPGKQRRAGAADMQMASGTGSETGNDGHD